MSEGGSGPTLVPVDSFLIREGDTLYIGTPGNPAIDPYDGTMYVADFYSSRVLRFNRQGEVVRTYGRPGSGPGEFQGPNLVHVLDDSTVIVENARPERIEFFDRNTGAFRYGLPAPGFDLGESPPVAIDGELWFPTVAQGERAALARWNPETGATLRAGAMPREYHASLDGPAHSYANHMLFGAMTPKDSTLVRGWFVRSDFMRYRLDGEVIDTVTIPAVRRRGTPADLQRVYDMDQPPERVTLNSVLGMMHTLPEGGLAYTFHDRDFLDGEGTIPNLISKMWLGVTTPDLEHACVDAEVPVSVDAQAVEAFRGDTIFVLDRRITGEANMETWMKLYRIDTSNCDWVSTRSHRE